MAAKGPTAATQKAEDPLLRRLTKVLPKQLCRAAVGSSGGAASPGVPSSVPSSLVSYNVGKSNLHVITPGAIKMYNLFWSAAHGMDRYAMSTLCGELLEDKCPTESFPCSSEPVQRSYLHVD